MRVILGTSGWQYHDWRGAFYPQGVAQVRWLEHYASRLATVESNAAFYRLPKAETFAAWARRTPDDFVIAVKASRYLTHVKRLAHPQEPVQRLLSAAVHLGPKLGPILLQLPPTLQKDSDALEATLACFASRARVAVEFRHDSWFVPEVRSLLEEAGAALCLADRGSRPVTPLWRTAPFTYVRLHAGTAAPQPCYGRAALEHWAERLRRGFGRDEDAYVYFNNDAHACAPRDARVFARAAMRAGHDVTRVPPEVIRVGN